VNAAVKRMDASAGTDPHSDLSGQRTTTMRFADRSVKP
jgi:hypothetical protein